MFTLNRGLFRILVLVVLAIHFSHAAYKIPAPLISIHNIGLEVCIQGSPGVELVIFHGRTNRVLKVNEPGELYGEITEPDKEGRWTYINTEKQLLLGDIIHYWIYVQHNGIGYRLDSQQFQVREYDKEVMPDIVTRDDPLPPPLKCDLSETRVNGEFACRRTVVFEDHFDSVDFSKWEPVTKFSSDYEDAEFNSYQNRTENYYVRNGALVIVPTLQSSVPGFDEHQIRTGKLDFGARCTADRANNEPRDCLREARSGYIIPPVVSAKLRTKNTLKFRYGEVTIRAKVPKGDWLFPELFLESSDRAYGTKSYQSGQIRIGFVRGNDRLSSNGQDIDGSQLSGMLVLSNRQEDRYKWTRTTSRNVHYGNDFHNYTLTWGPSSITMSVDGQLYANFRDQFCNVQSLCATIPHSTDWARGTYLAPFDQDFYISLGVGVGGLGDFPDGAVNGVGRTPKPWDNTDNQAERKFFADLKNWHATWNDESVLQVDYIKVTAL